MLTLRVFGTLSVESDSVALGPAASQSRPLALLAAAAMSGRKGISRDRLLLYLWPESNTANARSVLNQTLYALRRDLRSRELFLPGKSLRLNPEVMRCDAWAFEEALAMRQLEVACTVYEGPFLDGFHLRGAPEFEAWVEGERNRLGQRYYQALVTLAERADEQGNHNAAIGWWRRLMDFDGLSAIGAGGLITSLVATGDRGQAVRCARDYVERVERDLPGGVEPRILKLLTHLEEAPGKTLSAVSESQIHKLLSDQGAPERFTQPLFNQEASSKTRPASPSNKPANSHAELSFEGLVTSIADIIYSVDLPGNFTYTNPAGEKLLGLPANEIIGRSFLDFVREDFRNPMADFYARQIQHRTAITYYEFPVARSNPQEVWLGQQVQLCFDNGDPSGFIAVARDVTIARSLQDTTRREGVYDRLTNLVNAAAFRLMLDHRVALAQRIKKGFLLIFVTIENLDEVAGSDKRLADSMIKAVGTGLKNCFRTSDIVARLGAKNFGVLAVDGRANDLEVIRSRLAKEIAAMHSAAPSDAFPQLQVTGAFYDPELPLSVDALFATAPG